MTRLIYMDRILGSDAQRDRTQDRALRVSQLNKELRKLVHLITNEDECRIELFDQITNTVTALKDIKYRKDEARSLPKHHNVAVPEHYLCPISSELMRDPVILASGQTYDRAFIQAWLQEGHRTCPQTQQVLEHLILTPNHLIRNMIAQWCRSNGVDPPTEEAGSEPRSPCSLTSNDRQHVHHLLHKISLSEGSSEIETREAARELRLLTKKKPSYRILLADSLPLLLSLLSNSHAQTQEDAVTTLLNISIHDPNKTLIAAHEDAIAAIVRVVESGSTAEARANAAAALFSLSAVDDNKAKIGAAEGAIPALIELLAQGSPMAKKDSASALFNLCIHHSNRALCVRAGMVPALLNLVSNERDGLVEESLAILAMVASDPEAAMVMESGGALVCLINIVKGAHNPRTKENAIVILHAICSCDRNFLRELRSDEMVYNSVVELSESGTSRARRKASALLDRMRRKTERLPTM